MPTQPVVYYVAFFETCYDSLDDAVARAPDAVAAHRAHSQELHARGRLLMSGAFLSTHVWQLIEELRATEDTSRCLSLVAQITRQAYELLASSLELMRTAGAVAPELADLAEPGRDKAASEPGSADRSSAQSGSAAS